MCSSWYNNCVTLTPILTSTTHVSSPAPGHKPHELLPYYMRFRDHTQIHTSHSEVLLSTCVRVVAETATWQHTTFTTETSMPLAGFEPTIPASKLPQTHVLDRATTGTALILLLNHFNVVSFEPTNSCKQHLYCVWRIRWSSSLYQSVVWQVANVHCLRLTRTLHESWRWRQDVLPKRWYQPSGLHDFITQNTTVRIFYCQVEDS